MTSLRAFALTITLAIFAASPALADDVRDLFAGQHTDIGEVRVCDDGTDLFVTYDSSESDWYLTTTHLYADTTAPKKHAPGRFGYSNKNILTQVDEYVISLASLGASAGTDVYLAAHAETDEAVGYTAPSLDLALDIPATVSITSTFPGGDSYWNTTVSGGSSLDGTYDGWCVDNQTTMSPGTTYTAAVLSSYEAAAQGYVPHPENLDLVNHLINQDWVGQTSSCGGTYTQGDVQRAIWELIESQNSTNGLGSWSQCRADEIVADAILNGDLYEPGCFDQMAVMLVPISGTGGVAAQVIVAQVTVIEVDLECDPILSGSGETAWADGNISFNRSWASYWNYAVGSESCQ